MTIDQTFEKWLMEQWPGYKQTDQKTPWCYDLKSAFLAGAAAREAEILEIAIELQEFSASGSNDAYEAGYRDAAFELDRRIRQQAEGEKQRT